MESAQRIIVPVAADSVESPTVLFGREVTGVYFVTKDEQHGRVTFENLDALRVCRGEGLPYPSDWKPGEEYSWVYRVTNSNWQKERYSYEKRFYGKAYEFGGNVEEMLTDFGHFLFSFHDEFVEAIAKGFWIEQNERSLFQRELSTGHPLLDLPEENPERFNAHSLTCQIRKNSLSNDRLTANARFCSQKLMQFALELEGNATVNNSLVLSYRDGKLVSSLRGYYGNQLIEFPGIADFEDVKPYIESYMEDVYERRKAMGK